MPSTLIPYRLLAEQQAANEKNVSILVKIITWLFIVNLILIIVFAFFSRVEINLETDSDTTGHRTETVVHSVK